jgi:hypothetical protein
VRTSLIPKNCFARRFPLNRIAGSFAVPAAAGEVLPPVAQAGRRVS